jgi:hypothetical protein
MGASGTSWWWSRHSYCQIHLRESQQLSMSLLVSFVGNIGKKETPGLAQVETGIAAQHVSRNNWEIQIEIIH